MRTALITGLALAAASCASSQSAERASGASSSAQYAGSSAGGMTMDMCPMAVPGTTVSAQDTQAGEALTFATNSGQVAELRRRVRAMVDMHNRHHAGGETMGGMGHGGMMGGGSAPGHGQMHGDHHVMMPPPSRASVEDVEGGARIALVPQDPAAIEQLRSAVQMHAEHMQKEGCSGMMGGRSR